jgi:hypothetical protein
MFFRKEDILIQIEKISFRSSKKRLNSSLPRLVNSHSARSHMPIATWVKALSFVYEDTDSHHLHDGFLFRLILSFNQHLNVNEEHGE